MRVRGGGPVSGPPLCISTQGDHALWNALVMTRSLVALLLLVAASLPARARAQALAREAHIAVDSGTVAHVARLPASAFRNANGSPRLRDDQYAFVRARIVPLLEQWSRDPRLAIDPAYVTALVLKESGGDSLAVSGAPALGIAQLTTEADSDMRLMVTEYHFQWMAPEVNAWPRAAAVRTPTITAAAIDSMLAHGTVGSRNEYLFDPRTSARAAVFWVRLLENKWTTDFWPGGYGPSVRARLNGGKPLTAHQMFDLVTVSYNRGYIEVKALVDRYGLEWTTHLSELTGGQSGGRGLSRARARLYGGAAIRGHRARHRLARTIGPAVTEVAQCNFSWARDVLASAGPEPVRTTSNIDRTKIERAVRPGCVLTVEGCVPPCPVRSPSKPRTNGSSVFLFFQRIDRTKNCKAASRRYRTSNFAPLSRAPPLGASERYSSNDSWLAATIARAFRPAVNGPHDLSL